MSDRHHAQTHNSEFRSMTTEWDEHHMSLPFSTRSNPSYALSPSIEAVEGSSASKEAIDPPVRIRCRDSTESLTINEIRSGMQVKYTTLENCYDNCRCFTFWVETGSWVNLRFPLSLASGEVVKSFILWSIHHEKTLV